jgi:diacylglycerol kinase
VSGGGWRFRTSLGHAIRGIAEAVKSERHMRFHLVAAILVVLVAGKLRLSAGEWLWILVAIASVWIAELFNTAIERLVDLASPGIHPLAKAAKDMAAGAVLVASVFAASVGFIILGPPLWELLT